jgi:hypothetical protein
MKVAHMCDGIVESRPGFRVNEGCVLCTGLHGRARMACAWASIAPRNALGVAVSFVIAYLADSVWSFLHYSYL